MMEKSVLGDQPAPIWLGSLSSPAQKGKLVFLLGLAVLLAIAWLAQPL